MKKTSFSALMTQMHNLSQGIVSPPRLNASISAAVASIYEKSDCVVVLDDLFPSDSKEVRRRQEETLIEITRVIGDGIEPARIRGNKVTKAAPTCGVLFTGEYPIGTGSSAARLLVVEMTLPDLERLREFQNNPLIVSTFYHWFAMWFISNYGDIVELLKEWHCAYTKTRFGVHDRLQETHFFLNTAYSLLLQYCYDKGFLSEQDAGVLYCSFFKLLTLLIRAQQERVEQGKAGEVEKIDFLSCIRAAYKGGKFFLADRAKSFKDGQHDGVIHNNELCLRAAKLRQLFPGISLDDIACDLLSQGALRTTGTGKREIQIYETGGRRFYAIPMSKIQ